MFGIKKIEQVSSFQICIWFYSAIFYFEVIKNQSGKGTFWTPCTSDMLTPTFITIVELTNKGMNLVDGSRV